MHFHIQWLGNLWLLAAYGFCALFCLSLGKAAQRGDQMNEEAHREYQAALDIEAQQRTERALQEIQEIEQEAALR